MSSRGSSNTDPCLPCTRTSLETGNLFCEACTCVEVLRRAKGRLQWLRRLTISISHSASLVQHPSMGHYASLCNVRPAAPCHRLPSLLSPVCINAPTTMTSQCLPGGSVGIVCRRRKRRPTSPHALDHVHAKLMSVGAVCTLSANIRTGLYIKWRLLSQVRIGMVRQASLAEP